MKTFWLYVGITLLLVSGCATNIPKNNDLPEWQNSGVNPWFWNQ